MKEDLQETLASILRFRPWTHGDPPAPWILSELDKNQLVELAKTAMELNQAVLEAQVKANARAIEIIGRTGR